MPLLETSDGASVVPTWIDGRPLPLDGSSLMEVQSARLGKIVYRAQAATPDMAHQAASSAYRAFLDWKQTTYTHRRDLLLRVAEIYERRVEELVQYQCEETSCEEAWARFNVKLACNTLREVAANISQACTGELPPVTPGVLCLVYKEPVGPVLAICPWNACVVLSTRALACPIGAGCTVVFKASELCPRTHHAVVEAFTEAGLPPGCLNQLQVHRNDASAVSEALISDTAIRKVEFIGSARVGAIIGQLSSKYLKPVFMELGGKAPAIVLKDADLQRAAKLCTLGAFLHHGQICMSTERIIVVREVADLFSDHLKKEVEHHANGVGFAVSKSFAEHAHTLLQESKKDGASSLVNSAEWIGASGASLKPTILTNVTPNHRIFDEETFGPSASLYVVENEQEAITLANNTSYGLNAAVHSNDTLAALRVAKQLEFGQVHIGTITEYDEANAPIGGVKGSGWGRNNGRYGLREFLVEKTISVHEPTAQIDFG